MNWYIRILATIWGGVICGIVVFLAAGRIIPPEHLLVQDFYYTAGSDGREAPVIDWHDFLQQQQEKIKQIAGKINPLLASNLIIKNDETVGKLSLCLQRVKGIEQLDRDFEQLVERYVAERRREETGQAGYTFSTGSNVEERLHKWLRERENHLEELRQELILLQAQAARVSAAQVVLKQQLNSKLPANPSADFQSFSAAFLQNQIAQDDQIKSLKQKEAALKRQMAQLDIEAGQATTNDALENIDQKRERLHQQIYVIQEQIRNRQDSLSSMNQGVIWQYYQEYIKKRIAEHEQQLQQNAERAAAVQAELQQLDDKVQLVRSFLPQEKSKILQKVKAMNTGLTKSRPKLHLPLSATHTITGVNNLQYLAGALAVLAGGCLGLFLCSLLAPRYQEQSTNIVQGQNDILRQLEEFAADVRAQMQDHVKPAVDTGTPQPATESTSGRVLETGRQSGPDSVSSSVPPAEPEQDVGGTAIPPVSVQTPEAAESVQEEEATLPPAGKAGESTAGKLAALPEEIAGNYADRLNRVIDKLSQNIKKPAERPHKAPGKNSRQEGTVSDIDEHDDKPLQKQEQQDRTATGEVAEITSGIYDRPAEILDKLRQESTCPIVTVYSGSKDLPTARTSVNLAIACSRRGLNVLLIDNNRRSDELNRVFECSLTSGFGSWRAGQTRLADSLMVTPLERLFFMPAGSGKDDATNAFAINIRPEQHEELASYFDIVILHNPVELSETSGPQAEQSGETERLMISGAFCLLRPSEVRAGHIQKIRSLLKQHEIKLLGVITARV